MSDSTITVNFGYNTYVFPSGMSDDAIASGLGIGRHDYKWSRVVVDGETQLWIVPKSGQKG